MDYTKIIRVCLAFAADRATLVIDR